MSLHDTVGAAPFVRGHVRRYRVWDDGIVSLLGGRANQIQLTWGMIAAMTIGLGRRDYRINGLFIEYENMTDPDDIAVTPDFERAAGLEYYDDLLVSSTRDFLRVPLIQNPLLSIEPGYEDTFIEGETGNRLTFFTQTQGTVGVHGKAFSNAANSKVVGAALVAIPTFQDRARDVILARTYFAADEQVLKLPSSQVGIAWDVSFL